MYIDENIIFGFITGWIYLLACHKHFKMLCYSPPVKSSFVSTSTCLFYSKLTFVTLFSFTSSTGLIDRSYSSIVMSRVLHINRYSISISILVAHVVKLIALELVGSQVVFHSNSCTSHCFARLGRYFIVPMWGICACRQLHIDRRDMFLYGGSVAVALTSWLRFISLLYIPNSSGGSLERWLEGV